jgi:hypothetical protein
MTLDLQVSALIDGAPDAASRKSVKTIAPVLIQLAKSLPQATYYICQSPEGEWVVTTLQNQQQPKLEISVIYAFTRVEDVSQFQGGALANSLAIEVPIIQLLFYLFAFPEIDRIIFLDDSQNLDRGREISSQQLEDAIVKQLDAKPGSALPPDVC